MANVVIPHSDRGTPAFEEMDSYSNKYLLNGAEPGLQMGRALPLANSTSFAQYSVVGLNGSGKIALAKFDKTVQALGVLPHAVSLGASGAQNAPVWFTGNFNSDALVWDASFDTDAKKAAAFDGAPTPTSILCGKRGA